jgi:hypothetical protein
LGGHGAGQQFIETEPKLGYRFVAPVRILASGSGSCPILSVAPTFRSAGAGLKASATSQIRAVPAGGAYVPTVFVGMHAPLGTSMPSQHFVHSQD